MQRRTLVAMLVATFGGAPAALAQQNTMPVLGFLGGATSEASAPFVTAFQQGLAEAGFGERSVAIEYRWADGQYDRLPALAADLVARRVALIATSGGPLPARAARNATSTIPIVFVSGDPVGDGLVASLAKPGGNLTGVSLFVVELHPKRFELLLELVPRATVIALLTNPENPQTAGVVRELDGVARTRDVRLSILKANAESAIDNAFASLDQLGCQGLVVQADPFLNNQREQLVSLASRNGIPTIHEWRESVTIGGLISYAPRRTEMYRQVGILAGKILKGAKPADLPVEQPTKFELVINLKTARALGLTVPQTLLGRADEVIE